MATSERTIRYDAGNYEALFLPVGEKVSTEFANGRVRCIFTIETEDDFARAEKILTSFREVLAIYKS